MSTKIISVSELKARLGALIDELEKQGIPFYVTQHGKPAAVLARYDEYEGLLQRIEDLEDLLAMKEALETPEEEAVTLKGYERRRKSGF
jgi:prevent-host-death family protein